MTRFGKISGIDLTKSVIVIGVPFSQPPRPQYLKHILLITIRMDLNGNENEYEEEISRRCRII